MRRRNVLTTLGVSFAPFTLAGCTGISSLEDNAGGAESPNTETGSPSPLTEFDCPPYDSNTDHFVCSHTANTDSESVYLLPSHETAEASAETLELTIYNHSPADLEFNPYSWTLSVYRESEWKQVEQEDHGDGKLTVPAGERHTWTFAEVLDYVNQNATIDAGTYAAEISVPAPEASGWIALVALFRLE